MRTRTGALTSVCLLLGVFLSFVFAGTPSAGAFMITNEAEEALAQGAAEAHLPALAVAVVDADSILWEQVYGKDAQPGTPFPLGSLSKSFTALAILQLEEQGVLSLDAPLREYLPDVQVEATIRQLLNHTSGLGTYDTLSAYHQNEKTIGEHVYANLNYAFLGQVIQAVSGMEYDAYLRTHILEPLRMDETCIGAADGLVPGYTNIFGIPAAVPPVSVSADSWIQPAAGRLSSSLRDMEKYLQMYLRGGEGLLSENSIYTMMHDGVSVQDTIPYLYAMGWTRIDDPLAVPVYRHAGLVETGMACMYLIPDLGAGIIFLTNMNDYLVGADLMDRIGWNLVLRITGDEPGVIEAGEYGRSHAAWDLLYAGVLMLGICPLILLRKSLNRLKKLPVRRALLKVILIYIACPGVLLMLVNVAVAPLWVIQAFVPDMYWSLLCSVFLVWLSGVIRILALLRRDRQTPAEQTLPE